MKEEIPLLEIKVNDAEAAAHILVIELAVQAIML